jgi:hypothetical protein
MDPVVAVLLLDAFANSNYSSGTEEVGSVISWGDVISLMLIVFDHGHQLVNCVKSVLQCRRSRAAMND